MGEPELQPAARNLLGSNPHLCRSLPAHLNYRCPCLRHGRRSTERLTFMPTQNEKALAFRALHERDRAFIIPNPWNMGTARMLSSLGFEALATTSAGFAFSRGRPDYGVDRNEMLAHLAAMVAATALPVSADLENGFGDEPEVAAETIRLAAAAGVVGGSIEDATSRTSEPIYDFAQAVDRVRAAAEAAHKLS